MKLLYKLTNQSVAAKSVDGAQAISVQDLNVLRQEDEGRMNHHINKLTAYLLANSTAFPEYTVVNEDGLPADSSPANCNVFIDDRDYSMGTNFTSWAFNQNN
jgi:hypothetical protein